MKKDKNNTQVDTSRRVTRSHSVEEIPEESSVAVQSVTIPQVPIVQSAVPHKSLVTSVRTIQTKMYSNWSTRHEVISSQNFAPLTLVSKLLTSAHRVPFSVKARRDELRSQLDAVLDGFRDVYTKTSRFPDEWRVNTTTGPIADLFDKIMSALDFGERYVSDAPSSSVTQKFSSLDDAKHSYYKSIQRLLDLLVRNTETSYTLYEIDNKTTFELKHSLVWN